MLTRPRAVENCVFCQIIIGESPAKFVEKGIHYVAFKPLRPHTPGHVLFVPRMHVVDAADNPMQTGMVMARAGAYVRDVVKGPANIITSIGAESTQTVFHLHLHVVPRGPQDGIRPSWPWRVRLSEGLGSNDIFPEKGYEELAAKFIYGDNISPL